MSKIIDKEQRAVVGELTNEFIQIIRQYIKSILSEVDGKESWDELFYNTLHSSQQNMWSQNIEDGKLPEELIDYGHLKSFCIRHKDLLSTAFNRKDVTRLPTWFDEINEIRSEWAHHNDIEIDDFKRGLGNMKRIAEALKEKELSSKIVDALSAKSPKSKTEVPTPESTNTIKAEEEPTEDDHNDGMSILSVPSSNNSFDEIVLDDLDRSLLDHFKGIAVKKELVSNVKSGANVPVFVLEYLLANSCSTDDPEKIKAGIANVKKILADHYVNPEESSLIHHRIRDNGRYKIIDKIEVSLDTNSDRYWAKLQNSNIKNAVIGDELVRAHEKMLMGGVWAVIDIIYDTESMQGNKLVPFVIEEIRPIQLSSFDNTKFINKRKEFSKQEWKNILLRSCGYEPSSEGITPRVEMLLLSRLIPLVESNFNFVELGPRSTGKSFVFKELSPYSILISGGQGTVAKLFVHGGTGKVGSVGQWDTICFDESTDKIFKERDAIPLMKDYMESGSFSRAGAGGEITGHASIVLNGNINQPVETVLKTSHLFAPLSDEVNEDTAFLDRIHFYLPGWEMVKFGPSNFTKHFGLSTDYFSECLKSFRKISYTDAIDEYFAFGSHLKTRDTKPVKKSVSGLIKLLHPDGKYTKEDVREYLTLALEMRRRVKEQLKRIGGMEFWDTNFSYIDKETQEEVYVALPEERGSNLIENTPLQPGVCYTCTSEGDSLALVRVEVVAIHGGGKLNITGISSTKVKEDVKNTYQYIKANEKSILNDRHSLSNYDITIQLSTILGSNLSTGIGSAVYTAIISAIYKKNMKAGLAVLGNISVGGAIERSVNFTDKVSMLSENGAKTVLVPMENVNELASIPQSVLGDTDVPFYMNSQMLMQKSILGE